MSVEYKFFIGFWIATMSLFVLGSALSVEGEFAVVGGVWLAGAIVSIVRRAWLGWRWPRISLLDVVLTAAGAVVLFVFMFVGAPLFPPASPAHLPWYLAAAGMGLFSILGGLRLVCDSEAEFRAACRGADQTGAPSAAPVEPMWKRAVGAVYILLAIGAGLAFMARLHFFAQAYTSGSPAPSGARIAALTERGATRYVTIEEKQLIDLFDLISSVGISAVVLGGLLLHFVLRIRVFGDAGARR